MTTTDTTELPACLVCDDTGWIGSRAGAKGHPCMHCDAFAQWEQANPDEAATLGWAKYPPRDISTDPALDPVNEQAISDLHNAPPANLSPAGWVELEDMQ